VSGPPPLSPIGLVLRRDGSFWHEGVRVTHPRLCAVLRRGVRFLEREGVFAVTLGPFRGQLEVEDVAFFVDAYDERSGRVALSDRSEEPLAADTLRVDADQALRCLVKDRRFPARFTRAAQAHLLDALEPASGEGLRLRAGGERVPVPGLEGALA
jgi:hypothetical protein